MNVLVQGASGGIGAALVGLLLQRSNVARVFATSRSSTKSKELEAMRERLPDKLVLLNLDVTKESSVQKAAAEVKSRTTRLHALWNVAGFLHDRNIQPERRLEHVSVEGLTKYFATNASSVLVVAKYFLPLLNHNANALLVNLSARVGSISDNRLGGWYGYRASKAAQNMMTKTLAIELRRRAPNMVCVAMHPGTVDTNLSKPFQRNVPASKLFSTARAAEQLLAIADSLQSSDSGRFFDWKGDEVPW